MYATVKGSCINCSGVILMGDEIEEVPQGISQNSAMTHMECPEQESDVPAQIRTGWRRMQPLLDVDFDGLPDEFPVSPTQWFRGDLNYL